MSDVWIINGIPGSGKTTIARHLAGQLERSAHLEGDLLHEMMVVGRVEHSTGAEADRQAELTDRNLCLVAKSFSNAGFVPVMDFIIDSAARLTTYTGFFSDHRIHLVTLVTTIETARQRFQKREAHEAGSGLEGLATKIESELRGKGFWLASSGLSVGQSVDLIFKHKAEALMS